MVPLGANPEPTSWVSWVDLENSIYNFKSLNSTTVTGSGHVRNMTAQLDETNLYDWQSYDCTKITTGQVQPPTGWVHVIVAPGDTVSDPDTIRNNIKETTDGNYKLNVSFTED